MDTKTKTPAQRKPKKYGIRKQWKMLCEYATERNGEIANMKIDDVLYEGGPTVGEFLLQHYLNKCIAPALRRVAAKAATEQGAEAAAAPAPAEEPVAATAQEKRPADALAPPPKKRVKAKKEPVQVTIQA